MTSARNYKVRYDVASAIGQGRRDYQEDSLATDFPIGSQIGFAVLSDGMGGHAAGDVASKIIVTEVFSELKLQSGTPEELAKTLPGILKEAAIAANNCVRCHVKTNPDTDGMGATLVAPVLIEDRLFWISIGDSPLYLYRDGDLQQLNEDHSMAPQIDFMVCSGMMLADVGKNHPDRNCLTSVLFGEDIPRIDCPDEPLQLEDRDVLIVASDGIQYLDNDRIASVLAECADAQSFDIAEKLMSDLEELGDPDQDNVSFSVIRVHRTETTAAKSGKERRAGARIWQWPGSMGQNNGDEQTDKVASG